MHMSFESKWEKIITDLEEPENETITHGFESA